jgi:hypothetical protein
LPRFFEFKFGYIAYEDVDMESKINVNVNVMVVENNFIAQRLAEIILSELGCKVEIAKDGETALSVADDVPWREAGMNNFIPNLLCKWQAEDILSEV